MRSPAGPTATETRNEYKVGEAGFPAVELFELPDPDPLDGVDVVDADTVELPETEPPDGEDDRPLELVVPLWWSTMWWSTTMSSSAWRSWATP